MQSPANPGADRVTVALPVVFSTPWTTYGTNELPSAIGTVIDALPTSELLRERSSVFGSLLVMVTVTPPCCVVPREAPVPTIRREPTVTAPGAVMFVCGLTEMLTESPTRPVAEAVTVVVQGSVAVPPVRRREGGGHLPIRYRR